MKLIFYLKGENIDLAREEVLAITRSKDYKQYDRILVLNTKRFNYSRLAFTKKVLKLVFISGIKDLESNIKKVNWQRHYKNDFCVRSHDLDNENKIADLIWYKLKNPKVKLENSSTRIEFFKQKNKIICGILIEDVGLGFQNRRPHQRPGFHPSSMIPKLARACVNLSGIKEREKLYDPFCGTGGMLIEAGMIGCKIWGSDISKDMLKKTEINLKDAKIKNYKIFEADATKSQVNCNAIVTDPPYGKSSALYKKDRTKLYEEFLNNAYNYLHKGTKLVMVLPTTIKFKNPFKKVKTIDFFVHFSMTRRIYVMEKD
jgi:tRNA (guanine10-N2)-dimethyltransferase